VLACHLERWGLRPWHRLLLAGTLTGVLVLLSREAAVVWLLLVSYPVLLTVARRRIASLAVDRGAAWRTAHAVVGCLGVGGLLMATAPLLSRGILLSVPLVTVWVTLGCPSLLQHLVPVLHRLGQRMGACGG
jgi:hypothetical protein